MNLFVLMVVLSPFTAVIPGSYGIYILCKKRVTIQKNYLTIGLLALFISLFISGVINKSLLSIGGSFLMIAYLGVAILSQRYFISKKRIYKVMKLLIYYTAITAVVGIIEKIAFVVIGKSAHRIFSTYGNPNMTGAWFGSILLIILFLKSQRISKKDSVLLNISLILITIALLLTESTGAFIALIGSIFIYFLLDKKRNNRKIIMMTFTIVVILLAFTFMQETINSITVVDEVKTSFNSRYDIWIGSVEMFSLKPLLGWGTLGTLEHGVEFMYNNGNVVHAHNLWMTFLVSGGVIALAIYLFIKINIIKDLKKIYIKCDNYICILTALNVMVVIQGLVDCSLYAPQLATLFIAANSIVFNMANGQISENDEEDQINIKSYKKDVVAN